ncbi:hypothetical protein ABN034_22445 [Actinopolymorpha sp. B11F2]|uniref:hypothetical protein n=1 Tax=Actinopolymorpha sp. B11F2 TaxID=3160862 RepID=UPI0032E3D093
MDGLIATSPLATLTACVQGWRYLAFALLVASYIGGISRRRSFFGWSAALVGVQVYTALLNAITAPFVQYLSFVICLGVIVGVIRVKQVVAVAAIVLIAWPAMFELRNEVREANGIDVSADVTATSRLRFDTFLTEASWYDVPVALEHAGLREIVRYGLIPRVLDPERPRLSTGMEINAFRGGAENTSYSFLALGTVYFFEGDTGVALFYTGWTLFASLLIWIRGAPGPLRLCMLSLVIAEPLSWISMYPESMIMVLQYAVAAVPVFVVLHATARSTRPGGESDRTEITAGREKC